MAVWSDGVKVMVIHKLKGFDIGITIFVPVLCGSSVMNRENVTTKNDEVTCKKCLKLLIDMDA